MGKRRTGKLRTPTKRRPSETPPIFSIRIGHTLNRHAWAPPQHGEAPFSAIAKSSSTFRIRPGTLLHDDKREKYFYDMILPLILVHQIWGIGVCTLAPGGPEKHSQWGHQRAFSAGSTMDRSNS